MHRVRSGTSARGRLDTGRLRRNAALTLGRQFYRPSTLQKMQLILLGHAVVLCTFVSGRHHNVLQGKRPANPS
jgi:hypothetical protein